MSTQLGRFPLLVSLAVLLAPGVAPAGDAEERKGRRLYYRMIGAQRNIPLRPKTRSIASMGGEGVTRTTGMADSGFTEYPFCSGTMDYTFAEQFAYFPRIASGVEIDPDATNVGDIVIDHVYEPDGCVWGQSGREFVQTFRATGRELVSASLLVATRPGVFRVALLDGGPGGPQIGPTRSLRSGHSIEWGHARWKAGDAPLVPGRTYGISIRRQDGDPFRPYLHATGNAYDDGLLHVDGRPLPETDMAAWILEEPPESSRALILGSDADGWAYAVTGVDFSPRTPNVRLISVKLSPVVEKCRDVVARVWSKDAAPRLLAGPERCASCARRDGVYTGHFLFAADEVKVEPGALLHLEVFTIPHKGRIPPPEDTPDVPSDIQVRIYGDVSPGGFPAIHNLRNRYEDDGREMRLSWRAFPPAPVEVELTRLGPRETKIFQLGPGEEELRITGLWRGHDHDLRLRATGADGLVWRSPVYRLRPPGGPHPPPPPYIYPDHPEVFLRLAPPPPLETSSRPIRFRRSVELTNPGFEDGLEGWERGPLGIVCATGGEYGISPPVGKNMAGWSSLAGNRREQVFAVSRIYQRFRATPGHAYVASARVHTSVTNGPRGDTRVRLSADPRGGAEFQDANASQWYWSDGRWMRFEHRFVAAAETATVGLEFFRWRDLDRASAYADHVLLLDLGPSPRGVADPAVPGKRPPKLTLADERVEAADRVEVFLDAPPGYAITGLGARAAADNVTTLKLRVQPLLEDGTLGEPEFIRGGWELDAGLEAEIQLPPGFVATGFGARIAPEWDVKTLALWGRPILPDGRLGEEKEFRAGVEPQGGLEKTVRVEAGRVLTSAGLRCSSNDVGGISARSARLASTASGRRGGS